MEGCSAPRRVEGRSGCNREIGTASNNDIWGGSRSKYGGWGTKIHKMVESGGAGETIKKVNNINGS